MIEKLKNSVGVWSFGANATRFVPDGYHLDLKAMSMEERVSAIVDKLGDILDGLEFHYPQEINEANLPRLQAIMGDTIDIYTIPLGFHSIHEFIHGAFINPKKEIRKLAIRTAKQAVNLCSETGANLIIWPGGEGYNYPFQINYVDAWNNFIDGIAEVVNHANSLNVKVFLEHKHGEPAQKILMRNIGMTLFVINKIASKGVEVKNVKVNMDWQHLVMNGENLAEYAALLLNEGLLGHHHANSGWGTFDDDNMVGAMNFMEALALAKVLQRYNYGINGERIGFDLYPYTEDVFQAVRRSILQWEYIYFIAKKIDDEALTEAEANRDAVRAYEIVYKALGLDEDFIKAVKKGLTS